jgi:hypothetical protein
MRRDFLAAAAAFLLIGGAGAETLAPGGFIAAPAGTSAAAEPWLAGTVVQDRLTHFSYTGWFTDLGAKPQTTHGAVTGTVQSRVVQAVDGTLDFYWRINVNSSAFLPIANFTLHGLAPATYNAAWRTDGLGSVSPATISESNTGVVNFAFGQYLPPSTEIYPGQSSYFIFLDTNAHAFKNSGSFSLESERDSGGSMMIDWGGSSGNFATFAPVWSTAAPAMRIALASTAADIAPVPEPSSTSLALGGLLAVGALARRRRR